MAEYIEEEREDMIKFVVNNYIDIIKDSDQETAFAIVHDLGNFGNIPLYKLKEQVEILDEANQEFFEAVDHR
jgi:hypothetical protein